MQRLFIAFFYSTLVLVLALSLLPLDEDFVSTGWDKTNHLLAFFVLAALFDNAYPKLSYWKHQCSLLILFGLLIECLQGLTTYRFFSLLDLVADAVGIIIFYPFRPLFSRYMRVLDQLLFKRLS